MGKKQSTHPPIYSLTHLLKSNHRERREKKELTEYTEFFVVVLTKT